jgi:predicted acyl esterase
VNPATPSWWRRGRYESDGVFKPLEQEGKDGYDTID